MIIFLFERSLENHERSYRRHLRNCFGGSDPAGTYREDVHAGATAYGSGIAF